MMFFMPKEQWRTRPGREETKKQTQREKKFLAARGGQKRREKSKGRKAEEKSEGRKAEEKSEEEKTNEGRGKDRASGRWVLPLHVVRMNVA